jgi:membrane protease YdiL (CAAX protease family)
MKAARIMPPFISALIEVAIMFAPALPAYLWLWPNISGTKWNTPVQVLVYIYFLAGTLWIGLRRWDLKTLGLNVSGWRLSAASGLALVSAQVLIIFSMNWELDLEPPGVAQLAWRAVYYFGVVGLVEELLFRGLLYHALQEWRGTRWAIIGSSIAFGVYHIGWMGPLGALGTAFIGLLFGLIRWRAGGILGLIFIHGLMDIISLELLTTLTPDLSQIPQVTQPFPFCIGYILFIAVPIFLALVLPSKNPSR